MFKWARSKRKGIKATKSSGSTTEEQRGASTVMGSSGSFAGASGAVVQDSTFIDNSQHFHNHPDSNGLSPEEGLEKLQQSIASSASFNAAERGVPPRCHERTRTAMLKNFASWFEEQSFEPSDRLTILVGSAGSGKTSLLQTAAEKAKTKDVLAASFFFWASDQERNHKHTLVPTLAYQLATSIPELRPYIGHAFSNDPTIVKKTLEYQMKTLVTQPIQKALQAKGSTSPRSWPQVIIIDGLDECRGDAKAEEHQREILQAIALVLLDINIRFPFHILLSTRPELAIEHAINMYLKNLAHEINLNNAEDTETDIRLFIEMELDDLRRTHPLLHGVKDWPSQQDLSQLISLSGDHFIYPSIVLNFIKELRGDPIKRLDIILSLGKGAEPTKSNPLAPLDVLYTEILKRAQEKLNSSLDDEGDEYEYSIARAIELIGFMKERTELMRYMNKEGFDATLLLRPGTLVHRFCDIHSIFDIKTMMPHHRSLTDYLDSPSRCGAFYFPKYENERYLIKCLLHHLNNAALDPETPMCYGASFYIYPFFLDFINKAKADDFELQWLVELNTFLKSLVANNDLATVSPGPLTKRACKFIKDTGSQTIFDFERQIRFIQAIEESKHRDTEEWIETKLRTRQQCISYKISSPRKNDDPHLDRLLRMLDSKLSLPSFTDEDAAIYERLTKSKPPGSR